MLTDEQYQADIDDLARDIMRGLDWRNASLFEVETESERQCVYGGDEHWTHYASEMLYGSSYGPSLDQIIIDELWFDMDDDDRDELYSWSVADDLMDVCNDMFPFAPECVAQFVTMDDNCLWAIWLFDGDPMEEK